MAKKEHPKSDSHETVPKGDLHEGDVAHEALAEKAAAAAQVSPAEEAARLRALPDADLLKLADEAARADHWLDVARRTQAELENTVRRLRRDSDDALKYANSGIAREMLPVLDNLSRALDAAAKSKDFEGLFKGVELTQKLFQDALARFGIQPIETVGATFDPAFHEALMTASRDDLENNAVAAEFERGYRLHDRVLRAAKVQVNKK